MLSGAPSGLLTSPPSYLYLEYNDDPDLQAMVTAWNNYLQAYIDAFNNLNLPIYPAIFGTTSRYTLRCSGAYGSEPHNAFAYNDGGELPFAVHQDNPLLDWVCTNLYGVPRPVFGAAGPAYRTGGQYNTTPYDTTLYNAARLVRTYTYSVATSDQYKRVVTWNFYKGDGYQFNGRWLKRRVLRFLTGENGTDPGVSTTYLVSVTFLGGDQIAIAVDPSIAGQLPALQQALAGGFLLVPFQYTFTVGTI